MTNDRRKSPSGGRAAKRRPAEGDSRRADAGFSFIEIVVTIVLMGVVVVPILAAVRSSIRSSSVSQEAAQVETVLVNAIDRVSRAPRTSPFTCDLSQPAVAAVETQGWSAADVVVTQEHLDGSGTWQPGACPSVAGVPTFQNGLVQRVTITIQSPDEGVSRSLQVVKSDI